MIPYIAQPVLRLGPIHVYAFGVLVALAVIVGSWIARRRARAQGLDERLLSDLLTWVVVGGFLGGHVVDAILYEPGKVVSDPLSLLRIWESLGSFGGFVGGALGALLFMRRRSLGSEASSYLDAIAYAFPFGWIFGRLGCALAFDHPGTATGLFLGERFVDGVTRHNLGLDEALFAIVVATSFYVLGRRQRRAGFFVALLPLLYAPVRFALDGLRIGDARYAGLTPAQIGSLALVAVGFGIALSIRRVAAQRMSVA